MTSSRAKEFNKKFEREEQQNERNLSQIWRKGLAGGLAGCAVRVSGIPQEKFAYTDNTAG